MCPVSEILGETLVYHPTPMRAWACVQSRTDTSGGKDGKTHEGLHNPSLSIRDIRQPMPHPGNHLLLLLHLCKQDWEVTSGSWGRHTQDSCFFASEENPSLLCYLCTVLLSFFQDPKTLGRLSTGSDHIIHSGLCPFHRCGRQNPGE